MRRFLWAAPLLFVLISSGAWADSVSIDLGVNFGIGYNFGFEQQSPGMTVFLDGGTNVLLDYGYAPGSTLSAFDAPVFYDDGLARIGGVDYDLTWTSTGLLYMSSFTLPTPTNGATIISEPVVLTFSGSLIIAATGQIINVGGSSAGKITFFMGTDPDLYYAGGFTTVPEPGTVGLIGTGLIGIFFGRSEETQDLYVTLARFDFVKRSRLVSPSARSALGGGVTAQSCALVIFRRVRFPGLRELLKNVVSGYAFCNIASDRCVHFPLLYAPYEVADSVSANQIRSQRQEIDKAFQRHDAKQLATLFSSACHFTTAAVHIDGGDALEHFHETLFLKRLDVTLVHQTDRIVVNENWDVASERGEWIERWTEKDGITELRGSYLGLWRRESGQWREGDEILVPEACKGSSYCR